MYSCDWNLCLLPRAKGALSRFTISLGITKLNSKSRRDTGDTADCSLLARDRTWSKAAVCRGTWLSKQADLAQLDRAAQVGHTPVNGGKASSPASA